MYDYLARYLPPRVAFVLALAACLALLAAIFYCALEPQAEFRYMNL